MGLAVGKDGTIYVADSANGAIRKIFHGTVSTLTKGLDNPRSLALDSVGTLYVADHGSGLRIVSPSGELSALDSLSAKADRATCGVAVTGTGETRRLVYSDDHAIHVIDGGVDRTVAFAQVVDPIFEDQAIGNICDVAIVGKDTIIASDIRTNSLKLIRLRIDGPIGAPPTMRVLATGLRPAIGTVGAFADGAPAVAAVDVPRQLLQLPNGDVLLADSGNRRIRRLSGVDARGPVSPGFAGTLEIPKLDRKKYRVVFISNSYAFTNAWWPNSIPGVGAGIR